MKQIILVLMMALCMPGMLKAAEPVVEIVTTLGTVKVKLYDDTPRHRDNFVKLASEGAYDGVLFHRVINDFMVQTGDPDSKNATPDQMLGSGSIGDDIEAEIVYPRHYHKYGALAAARDNNPQKKSSGSQFYIVTGKKYDRSLIEERVEMAMMSSVMDSLIRANEPELREIAKSGDRAAFEARIAQLEEETATLIPQLPEEIITTYTTVGGTPHLDGEYTVFGEVIEGMDVIEKIQKVETNSMDRPIEDVKIISTKVVK